MTDGSLIESLGALPKELLVTSACGLLIVLILAWLVFRLLKQKHDVENIGLSRVETSFPDYPVTTDRREPGVDLDEEEEEPEPYDPLESAVTTPPHGTRVTERVFEPVTEKKTEAVPAEAEFRPVEKAPEPQIFREAPAWTFLQTLPFRMRRGLTTTHADIVGIGVEAVFFDADTVNRLSDPVMRLVPFLPDGELIARESDRKTFHMGSLHAQPDAVIETSPGLLSVEYKSKGGRCDDPTDLRRSVRTKDLLQTLIEAMVLSASTGRSVAPILRTHNAVYFLRPERRIMSLLSERIVAAEDFIAPYSTQSGISASDYAALCTVAAEKLFAAPLTEQNTAGQEAHRQMLG